MEQPILTPEIQRWTSAIVKLTSLTYSGKLKWTKRLSEVDPLDVSLSSKRVTTVRYNTELEGQRFVLIVSTPEQNGGVSWAQLTGMPGYNTKTNVILQAFNSHGQKVIDVTSLSVLQALADSVQSQLDNSEASVLAAIESA